MLFAVLQALAFIALPNDEQRAWIFFALSVVFAIVSSMLGVYVRRLRKERTDLENRLHQDSEEIVDQSLEYDSLSSLLKTCQFIDENLITNLGSDQPTRERRRRCVDLVLEGCRDNVLPNIEKTGRRLAFLEFSERERRFHVLAHRGLTHESIRDVADNLSYDNGLAGRTLQLRATVIIPDVDISEAKTHGWVRVGSSLRHQCIACIGVWLNDHPVGVISIDCNEKHAITAGDLDVLEDLAEKIRLIYAIFPDQRRNSRQPLS
jgi:hypothetical protein